MATSDHDFGMAREVKKTRDIVAGGSILAAVIGLAAGVLAILGLLGWYPLLFAAIATICVGVAFLIEGGSIAARTSKLVLEPASQSETDAITGGLAMESLAGIAGIVLGVLAMLGIKPLTLLCIASIVYGCGVLMESGALARLNTLILSGSKLVDKAQYYAHEAVNATAGIDMLCGLAGIVLGVLGLLGYVPLMLVLIAMLSFGCVMLLSGAALTTKVLSVFSR